MKSEPGLRKAAWSMALVATITVTAGTALAANDADLERFATALAKLRGEVETLSASVDSAREDRRNRLRSLASQKMDLELQVQREERRIDALEARAEKERARVAEVSIDDTDLGPALQRSIDVLRAEVAISLPFKRAERLAQLDGIEKGLKEGMLTPQKATARLWQFVEDELRLTRENGLYRQTINLDGESMLVDVARLGMVAVYFKTEDGRHGHTVRDGATWRYQTVTDKASKAQIDGLFDAFRKNIRVGYFQVPNAISGGAR